MIGAMPEDVSFRLKGPLMRRFLVLLAVFVLPSVAAAQEVKRVPLSEYVAFCLAVWDGASDVPAKASALGLQDAAGLSGASITIEKSTLRFFKPVQSNGSVGSINTVLEDGKASSCDISLAYPSDRADLEEMARALDLDGQILTLGPATMGHWKIRKRQPAVLLRAIVGKTNTNIGLMRFEQTNAASAKPVAAASKR
jgi:hypothetical protein